MVNLMPKKFKKYQDNRVNFSLKRPCLVIFDLVSVRFNFISRGFPSPITRTCTRSLSWETLSKSSLKTPLSFSEDLWLLSPPEKFERLQGEEGKEAWKTIARRKDRRKKKKSPFLEELIRGPLLASYTSTASESLSVFLKRAPGRFCSFF